VQHAHAGAARPSSQRKPARNGCLQRAFLRSARIFRTRKAAPHLGSHTAADRLTSDIFGFVGRVEYGSNEDMHKYMVADEATVYYRRDTHTVYIILRT
jgi:hypothetical protein